MADEDEELRAFLGSNAFGAKTELRDTDAAYARTRREAPEVVKSKHDASEDDSIEDSSDDEGDYPITHEITLKCHSRPVSGLALDAAANRIVSGSHDSTVAMWDFGGMSAECRPFSILEPFESHQIKSVGYNVSGEAILMTAASWQPKVITRDGEDMGELPRGDPYLRDMKNTRGHVGEVSAGIWSPVHKAQFATSSADSTIRLWDTLNVTKCLQIMVHKSKEAGAGRVKCTTSAFSPDGKTIAGAYADGTISLWNSEGPYHRPMGGSILAYDKGSDISGLDLSMDGWSMASRSSDGIKLWDRRKFKEPIASQVDLRALPESNIVFSPNNQELCTGVIHDDTAYLQLSSAKTLEPLQQLRFDSPVIKVIYNAKINQILTGHANGDIHVLYSPTTSTKGAKLVVAKAPKARHVDDLVTADIDQTAIDTVEDPEEAAVNRSRSKNSARRDPVLSKMPALPSSKRHTEKEIDPELKSLRDQDPREALLAYDEKAKADPMFFGIYKKTQPVTQFAELEDDVDQEPETSASKRFKFTPRGNK